MSEETNSLNFVNMHNTDEKIPYMEIDGEKTYFTTQNECFLNSQAIFIEYTDVIKSPYFLFLLMIIQNPDAFSKFFKVKILDGYDVESLTEWYINRDHQNPLLDLLRDDLLEKIKEPYLDEFINNQIIKIPDIIEKTPQMNMTRILNNLRIGNGELVKKVYIWYPYENKVIEDDIYKNINENVILLNGSISQAIDKVPDDSTYIFSDITNLDILYHKHKLYLSSILVANDYHYNFLSDNTPKINLEEYAKDVLFKFSYFSATYNV